VLFVPVISANTQARREGYFRIEWKLAAQRTHAIAEGTPFLLPVVLDDVSEPQALVPAEFREVQWTRLGTSEADAAFAQRVLTLLAEEVDSEGQPRGNTKPLVARRARNISLARKSWLAASVVAVALAIGLAVWTRQGGEPATGKSASFAPPVRSEAQVLTQKAWEQLNRPGRGRTELEIADDLCKRATGANSDDPDAWAAWSQVHSWYVYYSLDPSAERREAGPRGRSAGDATEPAIVRSPARRSVLPRADDEGRRQCRRQSLVGSNPGGGGDIACTVG